MNRLKLIHLQRICQWKNMSNYQKVLTLETVNPRLRDMEYVIRGPLLIRTAELTNELKQGVKKPFKEVTFLSYGDCQAMGQKPITFVRQVLSLCLLPKTFDNPDIPEDCKNRAELILNSCSGNSIGSYTESTGIQMIRQHCAKFVEQRDGFPCDWKNVFLSNGATESIKSVLALFDKPSPAGMKSGIMTPVPQYPLYSATLTELGMKKIDYYLDESKNWELNIEELERSVNEARKYCEPRAIVVINPGNPTGQVLSHENIQEIIKFAYKEKLFILSDEVYQHNIFGDSTFYSFKKVMSEMGSPYSEMELASFMSCSKGYMGECGIRGGFVELFNVCPDVRSILMKTISTLCPNTLGQAAVECLVNPPRPGELSYDQFLIEKSIILETYKERAELTTKGFNSIKGFSCNQVQGALYAFAKLEIPEKAIEAATKLNIAPDYFYSMELLENTGIATMPGSGFGQKPGTFHIRTTILPPKEKLQEMFNAWKKFHEEFLRRYE